MNYTVTSNYWTHYKNAHPEIAALYNPNAPQALSFQSSSQTSNAATFFTPRLSKPKESTTEAFQTKYRALLLDFVVSNNLALRIVDSISHRRLIQHCNSSILSISKQTLIRDLEKTFLSAQNALKVELQEHVKVGGRISITTDAWTATNFKEFIAVTGHWINKDWKQRSQLLDVVYLKDPLHSSEYIAEQLLSVTDDFNITEYIFTITRDNATPNDSMLDVFEEIAGEQRDQKPDNLQQPWSFTRREGDVRCIGHVINLAVQDALKTLKAEPAEETETYRMIYNSATLPIEFSKKDVISALWKLRRHVYIFRKRRAWRIALEKQCQAHRIKYRKPTLDMPVR